MPVLTVDAPGGGPAQVEGVGSDLRILTGKFDFDNNYPTGGEAMDLTRYFSQVLGVQFETKAGYIFEYDYAAGKVKALTPRAAIANTLAASVDAGATAVTSTAANGAIVTLAGVAGVAAGPGAEVANATDLSALVGVRFIAWGRR